MALSDIRSRFQLESGHRSMSDADALYYITAGLKNLDAKLVNIYHKKVAFEVSLGANEYLIDTSLFSSMDDFHAIDTVRYLNSDSKYVKLTRKDYDVLIEDYPKWSNTTTDTPAYWTVSPQEFFTAGGGTPTNIIGKGDALLIAVMPPLDQSYSFRLEGTRKVYTISADTDTEVFLTQHEDTVIAAAMLELYRHYGNSRLTKHWEAVLGDKVRNLDISQVLKEVTSASGRMNG